MNSGVMPELGNLAWAPVTAIEEVEICDRYNGVPTLGVFKGSDEAHLFWRAAGYTSDISLWLYVPLTVEDERRIEDDEGPGLLDLIVFRSPRPRFATVGVANLNRLVFEREWRIPPDLGQAGVLPLLLPYVSDALTLALREDLPASRREVYQKAETAVRQLTAC